MNIYLSCYLLFWSTTFSIQITINRQHILPPGKLTVTELQSFRQRCRCRRNSDRSRFWPCLRDRNIWNIKASYQSTWNYVAQVVIHGVAYRPNTTHNVVLMSIATFYVGLGTVRHCSGKYLQMRLAQALQPASLSHVYSTGLWCWNSNMKKYCGDRRRHFDAFLQTRLREL